ncbi:MAG: hypothetical protein LBE03_02805 [Candidatus Nomurabacteria bacterium]|jgi:hypothetical protein|nr:hypothetical protein [Candidatus Nomurabacteria bacterium]
MLSKFLKHLSKQQKIDILSVFIACIIITFITIAALSTNNIYYDTTGQQLLARQWLDGHFGGSSVSATSYIWKIFLFYMPSELLGLNPKISLYVLTILFNILTVIGLFAVIKAILKHFKVNHDSRLGLSMIWLSVMSVSIFWVGFANSRNLELVMGLTVLYFGLSLYKNKKASPKHIIMLSCLAGVVYFCDPMQLWITTTVLVGYVLIDNLPLLSRPPHPAKKALFKVIISVGGGIVIYQILILLAKNILKVHFFWMGDYLFTAIGAALANFPQVAAKTIDNIAYIFSGGIGTHPENILFAIIITIGAIVLLFHKKHSRDLRIFLPLFLLTTIIVPTLSGFNLFIGNSTPRFMIMLVPAIIILWSSVCLPNPKTIICIIIIWLVLELPTSINFMTNTNGQFSNETAMFEYREQLESSNYAYAW